VPRLSVLWLLALSLPVLLLGAPAAQAGWRTDRSLAIAQIVWHPACGQLSLGYGDRARDGARDGAIGWAWAGNCEIRIPNGSHYEFEVLCSTVLHEAGHAAGMGHSSNPRSVMYAERPFTKTTARIGGKTITQWTGADHRCLHHGRPFLEAHGVLTPTAAPAPAP
jgi:hypothetical protein